MKWGRKLSWKRCPFSSWWSTWSERQLGSQPSTLMANSLNPNYRLTHLLGHHASWGPQPLVWGLIVVRVIWGERGWGRLRSKEPGFPSWASGPALQRLPQAQESTPSNTPWPGSPKTQAEGTGSAIYTLRASQEGTRGCLATTGDLKRWQAWGSGEGTAFKKA